MNRDEIFNALVEKGYRKNVSAVMLYNFLQKEVDNYNKVQKEKNDLYFSCSVGGVLTMPTSIPEGAHAYFREDNIDPDVVNRIWSTEEIHVSYMYPRGEIFMLKGEHPTEGKEEKDAAVSALDAFFDTLGSTVDEKVYWLNLSADDFITKLKIIPRVNYPVTYPIIKFQLKFIDVISK